jgi:hypothetical protein
MLMDADGPVMLMTCPLLKDQPHTGGPAMLMDEPVLMTCPMLNDQPHAGRPAPC